MKKLLLLIPIILIIVLALIINSNSKEAHRDPLTIGAISGLTGEYAIVGQNWQKGVRLAHEIHQANPNNIRIELIEGDSGFDIKKGVSAYNKLKNVHHIDALINLDTFTMNGIYTMVSQEDFPVIQGGEQSIDPADDNVFQIMPGNIEAEKALGRHINEKGYTSVGLFYTNENTFAKFAQGFKDGYEGKVTEYPLAPDKKTDFRTDIIKAIGANHDAVVFITLPTQGALVAREYAQTATIKPRFVFDVSFSPTDYARIIEDMSILDGSIVVTLEQTSEDTFKKLYKERYGEDPGLFADWGYDAYNILLNNYNKNGEEWIGNVRTIEYEGASGPIEFDDVGVRLPQYEIKTVVDGELK